nr:Rid family hydrolase [Aminobacter anthyllidis]
MSAAAAERPKPLANYPSLREAGGLLFLSGVSARQKDGTIAGVIRQSGEANYDVAAQLRAIIANITESLQSVGGTLADLVDVNLCHRHGLLPGDEWRVQQVVWARRSGPHHRRRQPASAS